MEALVALLVLSVGLLGVAGLMLTAQRSSGQAYWQTVAYREADNLIERANANGVGAMAGNYVGNSKSPPGTTACSVTSPCTAAQTAGNDMTQWFQDIASSLPDGQATVATRLVNGTAWVTVTLQWITTPPGAIASGSTQSISLTEGFQP